LTGTLILVVAFVLVFFLKELPLRTSNKVSDTAPQPAGEANSALATENA
jgi:hypothetical protein